MSPVSKLCAAGKVIVTTGEPLVVLNPFVIVVPNGLTKGCIS